ncbi:MAG: urea carboxylase-associated family protein [Candidatus Limnocylindrales bacterium]
MTGTQSTRLQRGLGDEVVVEAGDVQDIVLERSQALRVRQLRGPQPVHVVLFAVADPREAVSAGHSRYQGFHLRSGHLLVSRPPWYRPMAVLTHVPQGASIDLLEPGCDADSARRAGLDLGGSGVSSCHDLLVKAAERAGLDGPDLPDAVNLWLRTTWDTAGAMGQLPARATPGATIELTAAMDVHVLVAPCVLAGFGAPGAFRNGSIGLSLRPATPARRRLIDAVAAPFDDLATEFGQPVPRPGRPRPRELTRDPDYRPAYRSFPLSRHEVDVALDAGSLARLRSLDGRPEASDAEIARSAFMRWSQAHLRRSPLLSR